MTKNNVMTIIGLVFLVATTLTYKTDIQFAGGVIIANMWIIASFFINE